MFFLVWWALYIIAVLAISAAAFLAYLISCETAYPDPRTSKYYLPELPESESEGGGCWTWLDRLLFRILGFVYPLSVDPRGNGELHEWWQNEAIKRGCDVTVGRFTPGRSLAAIYHPDDINALLCGEYKDKVVKHADYQVLENVLGRGLVTERDEKVHTVMRSTAGPAFAPQALQHYRESVIPLTGAQMLKDMSSAIDEQQQQREEQQQKGIDLDKPLMKFSLRSGLAAVFNLRFEEHVGTKLIQGANDLMRNISDVSFEMLLPRWLRKHYPSERNMTLMRSSATVGECTDTLIQRSEVRVAELQAAAKEQQQSFELPRNSSIVDHFVASDKPENMKQTHSNCTTIIAAATDTTQRALLWTLIELAKNTKLQQELYEELQESVALNAFPADHIADVPLLDAVINESLRHRPPVPIMGRVVTEEIKLPASGVTLPKSMQIAIIIHGVHHDRRFWGEDADEFNPYRWVNMSEETKSQLNRIWMPFLPRGSKRNCVGKDLALLEIRAALSALVRSFEFAWPEGAAEPVLDWAITLRPKVAVPLVVKRRTA